VLELVVFVASALVVLVALGLGEFGLLVMQLLVLLLKALLLVLLLLQKLERLLDDGRFEGAAFDVVLVEGERELVDTWQKRCEANHVVSILIFDDLRHYIVMVGIYNLSI
jgi:hypothetical protein